MSLALVGDRMPTSKLEGSHQQGSQEDRDWMGPGTGGSGEQEKLVDSCCPMCLRHRMNQVTRRASSLKSFAPVTSSWNVLSLHFSSFTAIPSTSPVMVRWCYTECVDRENHWGNWLTQVHVEGLRECDIMG